MTNKFLENATIVSGITPVNLAGAANTGDFVNLSQYGRCVIVAQKGIGTAGEDPVLTLEQATDAAGTGVKALNFTEIWSKVGTQTGIAAFTKTAQAAANTFVDAASAEAEAVFVLEVRAEQLDVNGGFTHLRLSIPDVGVAAQIGGVLYLLLDPKTGGASLPSAIA